MTPPALPAPIATLAAELSSLPGVVAVVLGGSRAAGTDTASSDWDLGLYYRGRLDPGDIRGLGHEGHVSELGEWGPIVDGGAWLTLDGTPVDVLFRDIDRVERWLDDARRGRFEILVQNGYIAGAPTYLPVGELAMCRPIAGELARPDFPDALATAAAARWQGRADVALMFAESYAEAADAVCCCGMLATAALSVAHARLAARREWVLNEKRLLDRAGLGDVQRLLARAGTTPAELTATVTAVALALGATPLRARPLAPAPAQHR
jgi:predicted nucleotidyltransferase